MSYIHMPLHMQSPSGESERLAGHAGHSKLRACPEKLEHLQLIVPGKQYLFESCIWPLLDICPGLPGQFSRVSIIYLNNYKRELFTR